MRCRILIGDVREKLAELPDESVHCVVTSPPYWSCRDYGVDGQLGLEPTPQAHVEVMVEVFREVRRVLRRDGVCWINYGDTFVGNTPGGGNGATSVLGSSKTQTASREGRIRGTRRPCGLKAKQRVGIPWRVALALQDDGWWLRADCIWWKPSAMPDSAKDRPGIDHEYVFMMTKSPRYFYDRTAVMEKATGTAKPRGSGVNPKAKSNATGSKQNASFSESVTDVTPLRNCRTVWAIHTQPHHGDHHAAFPEELASRCILAATSAEGCCAECGAPRARLLSEAEGDRGDWTSPELRDQGLNGGTGRGSVSHRAYRPPTTIGWEPTCECGGDDRVPCTVLDPFGGTGRTAIAALKHGRDAVLIELNPKTAEDARADIDERFSLFMAAEVVA